MKTYEIHQIKDNSNSYFYCVWEVLTGQAIEFYYFEEDAEEHTKFLLNGGAFCGFTPSFMLREAKNDKIDINKKFNKVFVAQS